MKLLEAIRDFDVKDEEMLDDIIYALEKRIDDIEFREPTDCGSYYDKWEEKLSDIYDILEGVTELKSMDIKDRKKRIKNIRMAVKYHQFYYGGLKRLCV